MPKSNNEVINKATITTTALAAGGMLQPWQAKKFLVQTFEATPLLKLVRHETRQERAGEIDKIGIGRRLLRKKTENTDDNYRAEVTHGKLEYSCVPVRLPWEITEETLRENIEGQEYEKIVTDLMTKAVGCDCEDLYLNGDTATPTSDPDYEFLYVNDGWIKQLVNGAHVEDRTSKNSGAMSLDVFYDTLKAIPNKFNNGKLRWLMSPHRRQDWEKYILNQAITVGGIVTDKRVENPTSIPIIEVPAMSNDKIILTDPQNLIAVNSYNVVIRKTMEGREAIMQDKRFYVIHFDFDTIIEELDAAAIITGLA